MPALRHAFGPEVFDTDGSLDRTGLRERVFANDEVRQRLELILHPLIRQEIARRLAQVSGNYAVVVIPLLVEKGGYYKLCQRVLLVDCSEEIQIARTMLRSNLSKSQVRAIMATQASRATRLEVADDVISNEGTLDELYEQVDRLHESYLEFTRMASRDSNPSSI